MTGTIDRRRTLALVISVGSIGGCLGGIREEHPFSLRDSRPDAGALLLENRTDEPEEVSVTVRKISNSDDGVPSNQPSPEQPTSEDVWHRTTSFEIGANERRVVGDFITETGTFFIEVTGRKDEFGTEWLALTEAYGGGVTGRYLDAVLTYREIRVTAGEPE